MSTATFDLMCLPCQTCAALVFKIAPLTTIFQIVALFHMLVLLNLLQVTIPHSLEFLFYHHQDHLLEEEYLNLMLE